MLCGIGYFEACEVDIVSTVLCRSSEVQVHDDIICDFVVALGACPDCNELVVIEGCFAFVAVCPLNAVELELGIVVVLNNETCGSAVLGNGDRNLHGCTRCSLLGADDPVGAADNDAVVNNHLTVLCRSFDRQTLGVGDFQLVKLDRILTRLGRCDEVQIHDNTVCALIGAGAVCPDNDLLVVVDGRFAAVAVCPGDALEGQTVILEVHDEAGGTVVIGNLDRNLDRCARTDLLLADGPLCLTGRCDLRGNHGSGRRRSVGNGRSRVRSVCAGHFRSSRLYRFSSRYVCLGNNDFEIMEIKAVRMILIDRNSLVLLRSVEADLIGALGLRSLDGEGVDRLGLVCSIFFRLCPCVNDLTLAHLVRSIVVIVEGRCDSVCTAALAADIIDLREVEVHLQTCSALVVLHIPLDCHLGARLDSNRVHARCAGSLRIIQILRDYIIGQLIGVGRLCRGGRIRVVADDDIEAVEHDLVFLGLVDRNSLVRGIRSRRSHADGISAVSGRNLHVEGVDDRIIISFVLLGLCPCVDALALLEVRGGLVVAVGRNDSVSIAALAADVLDLREVEVHLEACGALIVLDRPVDRQLFAGGRLVDVILQTVFLCGLVFLAARNQVVDNGACIRRSLRHSLAARNNDIQTVELELVRLCLINRKDNAFFLAAQADFVSALCRRNNNIKGIDRGTVRSFIFLGLRPCVDAFALLQLRGRRAVAVGRNDSVSRTALTADVLDLREVEVHLHTCGALIVLDRPVNRQLFAGVCIIDVVLACAGCRRVGLSARNQIVDDRSGRNRRGIGTALDRDIQSVERERDGLGLVNRNYLVIIQCAEADGIGSVCLRRLDIE